MKRKIIIQINNIFIGEFCYCDYYYSIDIVKYLLVYLCNDNFGK